MFKLNGEYVHLLRGSNRDYCTTIRLIRKLRENVIYSGSDL